MSAQLELKSSAFGLGESLTKRVEKKVEQNWGWNWKDFLSKVLKCRRYYISRHFSTNSYGWNEHFLDCLSVPMFTVSQYEHNTYAMQVAKFLHTLNFTHEQCYGVVSCVAHLNLVEMLDYVSNSHLNEIPPETNEMKESSSWRKEFFSSYQERHDSFSYSVNEYHSIWNKRNKKPDMTERRNKSLVLRSLQQCKS
jgi:hypothetical protein